MRRKLSCNLVSARHIALSLAILGVASVADANLIINGNFETGTFAGWTLFTTPNGRIGTTTTPGTPQVTPFDTSGSGVSNAAQFSVAEVTFTGLQEGGGIYQNFFAPGGQLSISVDIAVDRPSTVANQEGGVFSLLLDGVVLDSFVTGLIANTTVRSSLSAFGNYGAGAHELRILITRPFTESRYPLAQYVDNVVATSVPEAGTFALLGLGLAGLAALRRRKQ